MELDRARGINETLTILFIGRIGKGKSSLVNSLVGKHVAMETDSVYPVSQDILTSTFNMSGIRVAMIDTPGFTPVSASGSSPVLAETMKTIAETIPGYNVDLVVYCIRMTDRFDGTDERIIRELGKIYGEKIFTHMLFALTFANEVVPTRTNSNLCNVATFKKRQFDMTEAIRNEVLQKSASVSDTVAKHVPVVPVGRPQTLREMAVVDHLPDGSNWLSNFWYHALNRIHEPVKVAFNTHPYIKANDHRLLDQTIKT